MKLNTLLTAPQAVVDHFPMKALRLIRSWILDALSEPAEFMRQFVHASLQFLDRVPMTAEGVLESKIGQVIIRVTKTPNLPTHVALLAKRISEKLVTIVSIHSLFFPFLNFVFDISLISHI